MTQNVPGENCYPFGPHGIAGQHFDFEHNVDNPNNPNLPINTLPYPGAPPYIYNSQGVIYVEDGPVRVKVIIRVDIQLLRILILLQKTCMQ